MEPCLAATGADPTLPIVLAAALLALGAVIAIVAIRRGKAGAALLVLALPFLVGASLLGSASPALAQPGVPCPTPTPTPTCEPEIGIEDVTWEGSDWYSNDSGTFMLSDFSIDDISEFVTLDGLIRAIDDSPTVEATVWAQQGDTIVGPLAIGSGDFGIDGTTVSIPDNAYDEVTDGLASGAVWVALEYTYDDGCGGTLTTTLTFAGDFATIA